MGTFLFNFHAQTSDRGALGAALSTRKGAFPAYISEARNGWVSVYPSDGTSAIAYARAVSELLECVVLAFEVYDSDDCRCLLYNGGKRVARRKVGPEVDEPERGDAKRFSKYAPKGSEARLGDILAKDPVFAEETAYAIGEVFGIAHQHLEFSYRWAAHGDAPPPGVSHLSS